MGYKFKKKKSTDWFLIIKHGWDKGDKLSYFM